MAEQRSEIAFFDVETTVPTKQGQGFAILEFGAILVCPRKLVELENYSTLICPKDLSLISTKSERCNGISRAAVSVAPPFSLVADKVFDILNGRIWAGHNILRFDCPRIREAFAEIGRPSPQPKGIIDSLTLLTERFGRRAGNMKMASLATYFGLGQQTHRSLDDVRMNLEVLKYCATVLFLESSLPDILASDSLVSPTSARVTRSGGRVLPMSMSYTPDLVTNSPNHSNQTLGEQILNFIEPSRPGTESFNMARLSEEIMDDAIQVDNAAEERPLTEPSEARSLTIAEDSNSLSDFISPDDVSISSISAALAPFYIRNRRMQILHNSNVLKLYCNNLKVRFGISTKFMDQAGRPRLSFVVDAPPSLCQVLDVCDNHAQSLFKESGSMSDWRPIVTRKNGYWNSSTIRLHIPTVVTGNVAKYGTEMFQKEAASGAEQKLIFSKFDAAELESLIVAGSSIDVFFTFDQYDYQQNAGVRLVANKLVVCSM